MFWVVKGTDNYTEEDVSIVVEAKTVCEAEAMGWRRGIPVVIVEEATPADVKKATERKVLWRYTPEPKLKCFGRKVTYANAICLVMLGVLTAVLNLRAWNVPFKIPVHFF